MKVSLLLCSSSGNDIVTLWQSVALPSNPRCYSAIEAIQSVYADINVHCNCDMKVTVALWHQCHLAVLPSPRHQSNIKPTLLLLLLLWHDNNFVTMTVKPHYHCDTTATLFSVTPKSPTHRDPEATTLLWGLSHVIYCDTEAMFFTVTSKPPYLVRHPRHLIYCDAKATLLSVTPNPCYLVCHQSHVI